MRAFQERLHHFGPVSADQVLNLPNELSLRRLFPKYSASYRDNNNQQRRERKECIKSHRCSEPGRVVAEEIGYRRGRESPNVFPAEPDDSADFDAQARFAVDSRSR